jgi:PAS domain S-box-containing protein
MKTEFPDGTAGKERTDAAGSMQRVWQLLDSIPDAVVIVNKDGKIGTINAQTERSFGYSRRELLGQPVEILIPERFREKHRFYRARFTANPGVVPMGKVGGSKGLRKNGEEFPVEISLAPLEMDEREDVHILAIVRDTTEQTLAATQMSLHLATERVISSVLEASQNSRSLDELLDFALDQILGMPWISLDPRGAIFRWTTAIGINSESANSSTRGVGTR